MKTTSFRFILAALAATAALVGCTKEITPNFENDKVNSEGSRVIAVSFTPQTKTTLDGFQPRFANKDSILISNGEALDTCAVDVNGDKATITTNLTGPLAAVYPYKAAKMNESNLNQIDTILVSTVQSGKFADANICMAKMTSENDESLSFENKTAVFCITPGAGESTQYVEVSADGFEIANDVPTGSTRTIHVATTTADSVYVSILVPEGLTVGSLSFSDGTNVKTIKDERASTAIAAGTLYTVTNANWESTEADIPDGALKGVFTVSDNSTPNDPSDDIKVYFSQGNLVATINESGTPTAWKFATNQYDYHGEGGANKTIGNTTTSGTAGDVDLFGWSTASTTYGINTSTENSSYSGNFVDWGKAYCKSKSITPDNTWRTLSTEEWQYLFNYGSYTSEVRNGKYKYGVTVCGKANCVVLLPDGWKWEGDVGTEWQTEYPETQTNNEVTWQKMEDAGAVCLPAAGLRNGSYVDYVGDYGNYWSSTAIDSDYAYFVDFDSSIVYPDDIGDRLNGFSVRLVTNVSAAPTPTPTEPDYVEIGGKKWATKNLGATEVATDYRCYGDYYQWGSVEKLYTSITWTGNTTGSFVGLKTDGFAETNLTYKENADLSDATNDVVKKTYPGTNWRMPTKQEFQDLYDACVGADGYDTETNPTGTPIEKGVYWCDSYDGVAGVLFYDGTNVLFFPAAGYGDDTSLTSAGDYGDYWSSSLYTDYPAAAYGLYFDCSYVDPQSLGPRYRGFSVRPVSD